ncbi:hypothetical protein ACCS54_36470 [Rhizobium johnstonii]|uniref:Orn/Lys/Arg family decarboxylase n=1 Tax=Rhizobium johnstonii TaxID=3019933 RepID=UPI003F9BA60B
MSMKNEEKKRNQVQETPEPQGLIVKMIRTIAELRDFMRHNKRPICFISASPFNLMGIEGWVGNFTFISYIDPFDGRHPNVFVPSNIPGIEPKSFEEITNYLLQHPEVIDHITRLGVRPVVLFLMFDEKTEALSLALQQPLPPFSSFHPAFRPNMETEDGDMGQANDLAMEDDNCEYLQPADAERAISGGRVVVSASLVVPYPPGSPILVPGQVIDIPSLKYLRALDVREIHGFEHELGLWIFREETLSKVLSARKSTPEHGGES